ncbi:N-acetylmuramoyl-L-alanine amidase [Georgenia yuyongxinii]
MPLPRTTSLFAASALILASVGVSAAAGVTPPPPADLTAQSAQTTATPPTEKVPLPVDTTSENPGAAEPVTVISLTDVAGRRTAVAEEGLEQLGTDVSAGTRAAGAAAVLDAAGLGGGGAGRGLATVRLGALAGPARGGTVAAVAQNADLDKIAVLTPPIATEEFLVAGLTWDAQDSLPAGARMFLRVLEGGEWSQWLEAGEEDGADADEAPAGARAGTDPFVTGGADAVQVQVTGDAAALPASLELSLVPANPVPAEEVITETPDAPAQLPTEEPTATTEPAAFSSALGDLSLPPAPVRPVALSTDAVAHSGGSTSAVAARPVALSTAAAASPVALTSGVATAAQLGGVLPAAATAPQPTITSRSGWGADPAIMTWRPAYATLKGAILHHTAGTNDYTPAQSAAIVRGIYFFHAKTRGWGDIGYNFLVDKWGRVFEGRTGSLAAPAGKMPAGAHAGGFNTGTLGIAAMGDYTKVTPPREIFNSMANVIAWQFARAGIDLDTPSGIISPGTAAMPKGRNLGRIFGHRDVGNTSCPGDDIYAWIPTLTQAVDDQALQPSTSTTTSVRRRTASSATATSPRRSTWATGTATAWTPSPPGWAARSMSRTPTLTTSPTG